jgi:hypothetical protein
MELGVQKKGGIVCAEMYQIAAMGEDDNVEWRVRGPWMCVFSGRMILV